MVYEMRFVKKPWFEYDLVEGLVQLPVRIPEGADHACKSVLSVICLVRALGVLSESVYKRIVRETCGAAHRETISSESVVNILHFLYYSDPKFTTLCNIGKLTLDENGMTFPVILADALPISQLSRNQLQSKVIVINSLHQRIV